jgi:hypothetical protein
MFCSATYSSIILEGASSSACVDDSDMVGRLSGRRRDGRLSRKVRVLGERFGALYRSVELSSAFELLLSCTVCGLHGFADYMLY